MFPVQVARKVPTDRPDILMAIRISYVVILLLQFALYYVAALRIKKRNDTTVLKCVCAGYVHASARPAAVELTLALYLQPRPPTQILRAT